MTDQEKIKILKEAIDKLLRGISFALDENFSRKAVNARLIECRKDVIKTLTSTGHNKPNQNKQGVSQ